MDALRFTAALIEWRGPSPFYFAPLPGALIAPLREAARSASYGWGMIPVEATIGAVTFATSLFPRDDGYLLPLRDRVRHSLGVMPGDVVEVVLAVKPRR